MSIFVPKPIKMLILALIILLLEVLTFMVLREHYYKTSKPVFNFSITIHLLLSLWLWISLIRILVYKGFFDNPVNISNLLTLTGMISAVVFPRFLLSFLHFLGKLFRIRKGGHIRWLTGTGIIFSAVIFLVVESGILHGRFNFKTEEVTINIKDLDPGLDGLRIVQLSDLHLAGFYGHLDHLENVMDDVVAYRPDIIVNTGDFITYGWREFDRCDTILSRANGLYGNFAVLGNHDMGTYFPDASAEVMKAIEMKTNELVAASGYHLLNDEHTMADIKGVKIAIIGVITGGSHPDIIHGDLKKAIEGTDSADFKILLCHDPNQWDMDVVGKTDIDLAFTGHTHGGQFGILTKKFRWSPVQYFYPRWYGLFTEGNQYMYVNRGLGVLGVPCRICMPPEITVITLRAV